MLTIQHSSMIWITFSRESYIWYVLNIYSNNVMTSWVGSRWCWVDLGRRFEAPPVSEGYWSRVGVRYRRVNIKMFVDVSEVRSAMGGVLRVGLRLVGLRPLNQQRRLGWVDSGCRLCRVVLVVSGWTLTPQMIKALMLGWCWGFGLC